MDEFSYLSVLLSIVIGLAMTQALQGVRALVLARGAVKLFAPSLIWTGLIVLLAIQVWWSSFGLRDHRDWSFLAFTLVVTQSLCLYMLAALVLPDISDDKPVDLKAHYFRQRAWFYGVLLLTLVISLTKDMVINGELPSLGNLAFHAAFGVAAVAALAIRAAWYHQIQTPLVALAIVAYIAILFSRL